MNGNVVIFPGQGSQSVGMGKEVADASPAAAEVFARADDVLGFRLSAICFEGPESELTRTDIQQPAIFVTGVAIWEAMLEGGAEADVLLGATAGLSLGEYTALHVAGGLSFEDGLKLVRRRGELMQEAATAVPGAMASIIGGEASVVEGLCADAARGEVLSPANFNCPGQIVISGTRTACERAVALAGRHGLRGVMLKVAGAFHSSLMASAAEKLGAHLDATPFNPPRCAVIANVDASPHGDADATRDALRRQVTHAVRWQESMERLIANGAERFVEVGPGRVLTGLMRKIDRQAKTVNVNSVSDLQAASICSTATK